MCTFGSKKDVHLHMNNMHTRCLHMYMQSSQRWGATLTTICAYSHMNMRIHESTSLSTDFRASVNVCKCKQARAHAHACARAYTFTGMHACMHTLCWMYCDSRDTITHTCTYICTYMHAYIYDSSRYSHMCMYTYIHTYVHVYMYTYLCASTGFAVIIIT